MNERIYKSSTEKIVAGVCGGLAAYFGVDPVLVRAAFVVVTLLWGAGLIVYIVLALIMPTPDHGGTTSETIQHNIDDLSQEAQARAKELGDSLKLDGNRRRNAFAIILIVAGILLLVGHAGAFMFVTWVVIAPLLLIALGVAVLLGVFPQTPR